MQVFVLERKNLKIADFFNGNKATKSLFSWFSGGIEDRAML
jgi:hypothetical protein